ncbi:MAG: Cof-type HAD-IIB family hydrolase [Lachnospirales bacterium]
MYKLIAIDLDGTLLNNNKEISEINKKAIEKCINKGVHVFLTSGRSPLSMFPYIEPLGLNKIDAYMSAFSGSMIFDSNKNIVSEKFLDRDIALDILSKIPEENLGIVLYKTMNRLYTKNLNEFVKYYASNINLEVNIVKDFAEVEGDFKEVLIWCQSVEVLREVVKRFEYLYQGNKVKMMMGSSHILEFINPHCNKGASLEYICNHYGIDIEDTIAIGDSQNDIELLQKAGLGIAVANSLDSLKNAADIVSPYTNNENAVAKIIEDYIK